MQIISNGNQKENQMQKRKEGADVEFTSQQYIHISVEECTQLLSNICQHNPGDPLFDQ